MPGANVRKAPPQQRIRRRPRAPDARSSKAREGLAARSLAVDVLAGVLADRRPFEQAWSEHADRPDAAAGLEPRDRAFARALAATVLRRQGELEYVLNSFLERPLPARSRRLRPILLVGAAQLICLGTPAHAVVDLSVELTRSDGALHRFSGLTNAVLRRVAMEGPGLLAEQDATRLNIPGWLWQRWQTAYGAETARRIAQASLREAPLDVSLKSSSVESAAEWAERLGGRLLSTGSVRLEPGGRVEDLPGYAEGEWWVQDAAAALVARLAGDVRGRSVADLCAAPGGKTASLASAGARVTAVDISAARLARLRDNLSRLHLDAESIEADVASWAPEQRFDVVVLDAPCTATGTIRRHPDILRLKRVGDVGRMAELQRAMLAKAAETVARGGLLLYSTCSLEPEEGGGQITAFMDERPGFERVPVEPAEIGGHADWITPAGELRTLPFHMHLEPEALSGMDGFFVARLRRRL